MFVLCIRRTVRSCQQSNHKRNTKDNAQVNQRIQMKRFYRKDINKVRMEWSTGKGKYGDRRNNDRQKNAY